MSPELLADPWLSLSPTTLVALAAIWALSLLVVYFAGRSDEQRRSEP